MRETTSRGIYTRQHQNGRVEFMARLCHAGKRWVAGGFSTRQEALAALHKLKASVRSPLLPMKHRPHKSGSQHSVLIPVLEPMLQAALATHEATEERPRSLRPACHQRGLPANQNQKETGGQVESDILFHAYARRWFETSKAGWSQSSQDVNRSLCTRHLNPAFGTYRLCDISVELVERWLQKQLKTYSLCLCRNMRTALASIF